MRLSVLFFCGWFAAVPAFGSELDLGVNGDAFRLAFSSELGSGDLTWDAGWLHHDDNGDALHGGIYLGGEASSGTNPVRGGLGIRATLTDGDLSDQDGLNFALGGFFAYTLPTYDRFVVSGHAYYAPEVLGVGEIEKLQDYGLRLAYNVLKQADVYVGARYVRGDYEAAPSVRYDTGLHLGVALRF